MLKLTRTRRVGEDSFKPQSMSLSQVAAIKTSSLD